MTKNFPRERDVCRTLCSADKEEGCPRRPSFERERDIEMKKKPPTSSSLQIRATKKGQPPISAEKRKHFWVTVVKNVAGRDEEIELLCSRLGKRLGATARLVIEKGERWIEISGAHEKRARELLESEGVFVGLRKEKCALEEEEGEEEGSKSETKKEPRAKPRHANKRYWDTKTNLIKDSMMMVEEEDPVKPEDVLRVKQLRETNGEFARFCELMRKYPFWSHRYDKLAAMYFERRGGKEEEDEERRKKRRRCEIAFEEDEGEEEEEAGDGRDEDRHRGHPKSLEELGMVASASDFRMSREERAKASKQKKSAVVGLQDAKREKEEQHVEEYEDIATKMLRMRGFAPARKKPTTTSTTTTTTTATTSTATTSTTTTARRKPAMPPKKKIDSSVGISSGASAAFGRKAWSQKQFDKEDLIMSTTDDDEEEEEEEESLRQNVASRPLIGGRFLENKRNDESAFPSLRPTRRAAPPTSRTSEHRLPHEEYQQTTMSEEDALKLALSLSADEHARERMKMDEELERDLEVARAVSLSAREEEEARKRSSLSNDIAQTLRQLGFDRDVSETLANDVLPAMPTHQDVIDLLGTLGIEKQVAANFANFIVLNNENSAPDGNTANTGTDAKEEEKEEEKGEEEMFFNLSLRELTGTDSNRDLIQYVQKMEHREDAGEFLRESFGGNEETFRLGANIWDAGSSSRRR